MVNLREHYRDCIGAIIGIVYATDECSRMPAPAIPVVLHVWLHCLPGVVFMPLHKWRSHIKQLTFFMCCQPCLGNIPCADIETMEFSRKIRMFADQIIKK
jgi:hypothetical protein